MTVTLSWHIWHFQGARRPRITRRLSTKGQNVLLNTF